VPDSASRAIEGFVEYLSNWYVRRSRRRFWKSDTDDDKLSAYATLYECLVTLTKLLAPFMPFMTESMYQNLVPQQAGGRESVHLESYPLADESKIDLQLSEATRLAMRLSSMGRAARSKAGLKVRQPLEKALVKLRTPEEAQLLEHVIPQVQDELNVKEIVAFSDETEVLDFKVQANMPVLGPKYGMELHNIIAGLSAANPTEIYAQVSAGNIVDVEGYDLEPDEILVSSTDKEGYSVASEGGYTLAVATEVSAELALEGLARELVHRIQNMRRSAEFDIADYIVTYYQGSPELDEVMSVHGDYIQRETLSRQLVKGQPPEDAYTESHKVEGLEVTIGVKKE